MPSNCNRPACGVSGNDLKEMAGSSHIAQKLLERGVKSFCSLPLLSHNRTMGALNVGRRKDDVFGTEDVELLRQVAQQIAIAVENALAYKQIAELKDKLTEEKLYLQEEIQTEYNFQEIVGESQTLRRVLKEVQTVAATSSTVLILGETGSGKELIARALHNLSDRRERTFVKLNCAASRQVCWKANCSDMKEAPSPELLRPRSDALKRPIGVRCSSTKWEKFRSNCRSNCSGSCRNRSSSGWAARELCVSTCGLSRQRIATSGRWSRNRNFAATSITA